MILGLKDQFVPFVEDGSKRHSIRAGERWKAGMRADLYARPRQKGMRLLFRAFVVKVEPICIFIEPDGGPKIVLDGCLLHHAECDLFAYADGFRDGCTDSREYCTVGAFAQMIEFWQRTHDLAARPFVGQIIHWDYEGRFVEKPVGRRRSCVP